MKTLADLAPLILATAAVLIFGKYLGDHAVNWLGAVL